MDRSSKSCWNTALPVKQLKLSRNAVPMSLERSLHIISTSWSTIGLMIHSATGTYLRSHDLKLHSSFPPKVSYSPLPAQANICTANQLPNGQVTEKHSSEPQSAAQESSSLEAIQHPTISAPRKEEEERQQQEFSRNHIAHNLCWELWSKLLSEK